MRIAPKFISVCVALAVSGACAAQHNHVTVDTVSGSPGDKIIIKAGYLPAEGDYSISGGYLMHQGQIKVYAVSLQLAQSGQFHDWFAGDEIVLTSDFFLATGRLDGGDYSYELASVIPLSGSATTVAWGKFHGGGVFEHDAISTGMTRGERSFNVGLGGHPHDQGFAFEEHGMYDVEIIAWDVNGVYADSDPVKVRFHVEGGCYADCDGSGSLDFFDFLCFQNEFAGGHAYADCDGSGTLDFFDFLCFQNEFAAGCP